MMPVRAATRLQSPRLRAQHIPLGLGLATALLLAAAPQGAWAQSSLTRAQSFSYDATTAQLTQQVSEPDTAAIALTTTYTYDSFGNQLTATVSGPDITTRTTSATYTTDGRFLATATNALTHSETHVTDARFGVVTSLTGPNSLATTWEYDGFGRKTKETRADSTETRWTYELCVAQCPTGGVYLVSVQEFDDSGTASSAKTIEYLDKLNRVFRSETEGFDGTPVYVDTEFTARGEVHRVSKPYFQGTAALDIQWTTFAYDVVGRVTSVTLPDGGVESTAYSGLTTTLTNALSQTSTRVENALGELVSATDNLSNVTTYAYDVLGNLTETDAAGVVTTMTYDIRGLKLTMDDPDMGDWSYDYNALGELTEQTDAKGQVTTMAYDVLGRMTSRTDDFGTLDAVTTTWTYDTATKGKGKIASVSAPHDNYSEAMTYDSLGRPSIAAVTIDSTTYNTKTFYDAAGRADTLEYPTGHIVKSVFTARGHLAEVTDNLATVTYWRADTVNAEGQVTAETLGNGVTTTRVYDPATSRIDSILTTKGATTIQDLAFDFDLIGNLTERRDLRQDREEAFTYDGLNRLTQTTLTDTATLQTLGTPVTYSYDALGNITNKSDLGTYTYGSGLPGQPGPHAVVSAGANTYTYDANGAMITGAGKTTTWTAFNKPEEIVASVNDETFFVYGPSRARFKQNIKKGGLITDVVYIGSHFEKKVRLNEDDELVHYIRAGGATVAIYTEYRDSLNAVTSSKTRYLHRDHLGSVESITDEAGAISEQLSYDSHGKRRLGDWQAGTPTTPGETPRGFTGHEHLDAVGLIHMNGRVYDPTLGRFLSADPFVQAPETTQTFNRYSYVLNNPLSYTDPSGFNYDDLDGALGDLGSGGYDGPDARDDRSFVERVDDFLSDLLGVDKDARDYARANDVDYWSALDRVNVARAAVEVANQAFMSGGLPDEAYAQSVIAASQKYGVSRHAQTVAGVAGSVFDGLSRAAKDMTSDGLVVVAGPLNLAAASASASVTIPGTAVDGFAVVRGIISRPIVQRALTIAVAASLADGPAPVGEIIGAIVIAGALGSAIYDTITTEATTNSSEMPRPFALGLQAYLDQFAAYHGAETWDDYPGHWIPTVTAKLADPRVTIKFNLQGVDVWKGVQRAASGGEHGGTDWELLQVKKNPQWWGRIEFWDFDKRVPNPFE